MSPARPPDGTGGPHVFVDDLDDIRLDERDEAHLRRSLRLRDGAAITVCDGRGAWRAARLATTTEPVGPVIDVAPLSPELTVGFPPVKGERPDWAVQKLTEIGADRIVLLDTARGVVRWQADRLDRHLDRLGRIARESAMQSRRVRLPVLVGPITVAEMAAARPGAVALAQPGGASLSLDTPTVLVGPEGGWSPDERALGLPTIGLSRNVLRVETAALVAAVSLTLLRSTQMDDRGECW